MHDRLLSVGVGAFQVLRACRTALELVGRAFSRTASRACGARRSRGRRGAESAARFGDREAAGTYRIDAKVCRALLVVDPGGEQREEVVEQAEEVDERRCAEDLRA
eukprot:4046074-Pleurochrysis_carterae.AAC.1